LERNSSGDSSADYQRRISFDSLGRVEKEELAIRNASNRLQSFHTDYAYDLLGRPIEVHYPAKHFGIFGWLDSIIRFEYEGKFLQRVCEPGWGSDCASADMEFVSSTEFDSLGRLSSLTFPMGTRSFEYTTDTHRLAQDEFISPAYQYTRNYVSYDGVGNLTSIAGSESASSPLDMQEAYAYDARNRIERWIKGGTQYDYGYDDLGNLTMHAGRTQTYDDPDRPHAITQRDLVSPSSLTYNYNYNYDDDGNVKSIVGTGASLFFSFDSANRITCLGQGSNPCETRIAYDVHGKRIVEYPSGGNAFVAYVGDAFRYEHNLIVDHATIEIMLDGKRIALKRFRPQLRTATIGLFALRIDSRWIVGGLLGLGATLLVVAIRSGGLVLIQSRPLRAATSMAAIALVLAPSIAVAAVPTNASLPNYFWEISDALGTGMVMISESGERVRHQTFTPFGEIHDEVGSGFRTFFAGHRRDESSGMFYMQARWYDPGAGRFLSVDPVIRTQMNPQSANAYSYAENNPTNGIDPTGMHILGWTGPSGRLAGHSGFSDSVDTEANQPTADLNTLAAGASAGLNDALEGELNGGRAAATGGDPGSGSTGVETNAAPSQTGDAGATAGTGGGFWRGVGDFLAGEAFEISGAIVGTLWGIGKGLFQIGKGIVTGDLATIGRGFANLGATLMLRSGSASGLLHPGKGRAMTPATGTRLDNASLWHDGVQNLATDSAPQFEWIRRAWAGPGSELGPWGQVYRVYGTVGFGLIGAGQAALGF
jgi:RHS repeat-associated protein